MNNYKRTTVTSALPYANGPVHIGHLAGVYVPADIYVRYLRLKKEDVLFIGGSDEHGIPITIRARREGVTPQDIVDRGCGDQRSGRGGFTDHQARPFARHPQTTRNGCAVIL